MAKISDHFADTVICRNLTQTKGQSHLYIVAAEHINKTRAKWRSCCNFNGLFDFDGQKHILSDTKG